MSDVIGLSVGQFLDALASGASTPGGGSTAALSGAMAAGLISMVCHLSIGKKQLADFESEAQAILARSEELRAELKIHYVTHIEEVTSIALMPSSAQTHTGLVEEDVRQTVQ